MNPIDKIIAQSNVILTAAHSISKYENLVLDNKIIGLVEDSKLAEFYPTFHYYHNVLEHYFIIKFCDNFNYPLFEVKISELYLHYKNIPISIAILNKLNEEFNEICRWN